MCETAFATTTPALTLEPPPPSLFSRLGSRRRRLWELSRESHCPVIGVCLPLPLLRKLVGKALSQTAPLGDYDLHVGAVNACTRRNRLSDLLQEELDRRYATVIRRYKAAKTSEALESLWQEAVDEGDVAGPFWATLTHPRCTPVLELALCREMHMLQHQAGATTRVERSRFEALMQENAALLRELGKVQERCTRLVTEKTQELERLRQELMQARAALLCRDTTIACLRSDLAEVRETLPELEPRLQLKRKLNAEKAHTKALEQQLAALRQELSRAQAELAASRQHRSKAPACAEACPSAGQPSPRVAAEPKLQDKTVLCVGGRSGNVTDYRSIIERIGGRFVHHDGGLEDNLGQLDANLAAADLVICQTGCISHKAYWRVKDHCKRTGKRCVFVDNPSVSALARTLFPRLEENEAAKNATEDANPH